jgi:hypothetical protein
MRIRGSAFLSFLLLIFAQFLNNALPAQSVEFGQDATGDTNAVKVGGASGFVYSERIILTVGHVIESTGGLAYWERDGVIYKPGIVKIVGQKGYKVTILLATTNKKIKGFSEVIYSGITTVKMAEIILIILKKFPKLSGVYNISSKPISKFDLLNLCNVYFDVNAIIIADNSYISNKNLISENIFKQLKIEQPNWVTLIKQLVDDSLENNYLYN